MARGWESKDVESQLEAAGAERGSAPAARLTPEQQSIARRRETLELDRCRLLNDIERSTHPRYQEQLQAALAHVEAEIAKLV